MRSTPFGIELLYFFVGEPIALELSPRVDAAHVAKGEIASLSHVPLRTVLRVGAGWHAEDAACGFTIGFITRIVCCIKASVCFEFPFFASNPSHYTALDRAEVGTNQYMTGCCANHGAAAVAHHRERPRIQASNVLIVAGRYCSDGSIKINDGTF